MMSSHIMVLLKATGFIKSAYETYGKHDTEIARVLELITGYSNENFRKALSAGEINISAIDRGSADSEKKQMIDHLKQIGCKVTADKVNDLW